MMKLQRAKEQSDRLDADNRSLRELVCSLESQKKILLEQVRVNCINRFELSLYSSLGVRGCLSSWKQGTKTKILP